MPEIPPWLNITPRDQINAYAEGLRRNQQAATAAAQLAQQGAIAQAEIGQRAQQMAQQAQMAQVEMQAKQEALEKEHLLKQQGMEIAKSYKEQMLALQGQELQQKQQVQQQQLKEAAQRFSMQQLAQQRIAGGEDPSKVYQELGPIMGIPSAAYSAMNRGMSRAALPPQITSDVKGLQAGERFAINPNTGSWQFLPNKNNQEDWINKRKLITAQQVLAKLPSWGPDAMKMRKEQEDKISALEQNVLRSSAAQQGAAESPEETEALQQEEEEALQLEGLPEGWSVITQ